MDLLSSATLCFGTFGVGLVDWSIFDSWKADVLRYFTCCPICGSEHVVVHFSRAGRDTLACDVCRGKWHIHVGLSGLHWAELDNEGEGGRGKELLGKRFDKNEVQRMAQIARRPLRLRKMRMEKQATQRKQERALEGLARTLDS